MVSIHVRGGLSIEDSFIAARDLVARDDITLLGNGTFVGGDEAGLDQLVDARTGKLHAHGTLTKQEEGDLTLRGGASTGNAVDLDGTVDVVEGSLTIDVVNPNAHFTAQADLTASNDVTLMGTGVFDGLGDQLVDAEGGVLHATRTLSKINNGDLTLRGGAVGVTAVDLDDTVTVETDDLIIEAIRLYRARGRGPPDTT